jgi:hypothetical protein
VKRCLCAVSTIALLGASAFAQSTAATYVTDLNGRRVEAATTAANSEHTELSTSLNGKKVPLEQTEQRVISDGPGGKVTEAITRKYDANGQIASTQRVVIEEQKHSDGSSTVRATTYQSDVNGNFQQAERKTTQTRSQGDASQADVLVERPTINGSFETTEKRNVVSKKSGDTTQQTETVYRRAPGGDFVETLRQTKEERKAGDKTIENDAFYEPGVTGQLELARQSVTTTAKQADGSQTTQVDLYGRSVDGIVKDPGIALQLKEKQEIERVKGPGGEIVERVIVRRPSVNDPKTLGAPQQISETICKGKCEPEPPPVTAPAAAPAPATPPAAAPPAAAKN